MQAVEASTEAPMQASSRFHGCGGSFRGSGGNFRGSSGFSCNDETNNAEDRTEVIVRPEQMQSRQLLLPSSVLRELSLEECPVTMVLCCGGGGGTWQRKGYT